MKHNILDIKGLKVGQAQNTEAKTGVTVVIAEKGAVCGVDVRGAAPGTRETDLLNPINAMERVQAVVLSGGSAFGLEAASGVMDYLEEKGIGFDVGVTKVPIVPSAVLLIWAMEMPLCVLTKLWAELPAKPLPTKSSWKAITAQAAAQRSGNSMAWNTAATAASVPGQKLQKTASLWLPSLR